jgi:hypothetical protein
MTKTTARRWAHTAATAGVIGNGTLAVGHRGNRLPRSAPRPGGLADQQIAATILGCSALMLAGFAGNLGAAVWSATAVAVLAWLAIPVWVLVLGRTLVRPRSVLPETATVAV